MKYRGRIVLTLIILLLIITAKLYGYFYFKHPLTVFPFFGIVALCISWWMGGIYDKVRFLSEKDALTKIYNRRYVKQTFPRMLALVKRKKENLSLLFIDVNHFKKLNDTYGHDFGDKALLYISNVIVKNARKSDIVARWAGDEFLIIAPFIRVKDMKLKIEQIHNDLEKSKSSDEIHVDLSVSIGVSVYPSDGETLDSLLRIADKNMYKSKFASRER
jgi:diguanylate cyclase (GGDEF)-like protein